MCILGLFVISPAGMLPFMSKTLYNNLPIEKHYTLKNYTFNVNGFSVLCH